MLTAVVDPLDVRVHNNYYGHVPTEGGIPMPTSQDGTLATVAGVVYDHAKPQTVTGFPIRRGGATATVVFVDLLTADGAIVYGAQVTPSALAGIQVAPFRSSATDAFLWTVAEKNVGGWGERCLAELAFREASKAAQREVAIRVARLRRMPAASLVQR